jgi:bifunctional non-homologous end joining protein LigD
VIAARMPGQVTLERAVGKRDPGKIYIDYSQNGQGRPLTVVYSARPFPGAPVSAPVSEQELRPGLDPAEFTILTLPERLRNRGDLWEGFWKARQRLEPALARLGEELALTG